MRKKICVFGDSHARCFRTFRSAEFSLDLQPISAATIAGFGKRVSSLGVSNQIIHYLNQSETDVLLLKFGQVDIDFGYYYKRIVKKQQFDSLSYSHELADIYFEFIKKIGSALRHKRVVVFSINLPSLFSKANALKHTSKIIFENDIKDQSLLERNLKELSDLLPGIQERTNITLTFNNILGKKCFEENICYSDLTKECLDEKTKILKNIFHLEQDNDHHYKGFHYATRNVSPEILIKKHPKTYEIFNKALLKSITEIL